MKKMYLYGITVLMVVVCLTLVVNERGLWGQDSAESTQDAPKSKVGKNIQVLTHIESIVELQTFMKGVADSLGVTCKECHDLRDFSKDEKDKKLLAREMMKMQMGINDQLKKINNTLYKNTDKKLREEVTCFTCHRGHEHPANTAQEWEKILKGVE